MAHFLSDDTVAEKGEQDCRDDSKPCDDLKVDRIPINGVPLSCR